MAWHLIEQGTRLHEVGPGQAQGQFYLLPYKSQLLHKLKHND